MNLQLRPDTLIHHLIPASLCYLALPYLIFFAGWLRGSLALFYVGLTVLSLYLCIRNMDRTGEERKQPDETTLQQSQICHCEERFFATTQSPQPLGGHWMIWVVMVAVLLLAISGIGGYGYQDTDWIKHNAILKDLIERPWPVTLQVGEQNLPLVYYIAYYLPAAWLGKLGGWYLANQALFVWSLMGLVLAILWFLVLNRRITFTVVSLFVLFSGLDVIGELIARWVVAPLRPEVTSLLRWDHLEQWSIGWQYSSNATLLFWVPHQALAGWIATGIVLYTILYARPKKHSLFIVALTALWSPFATTGLLPYLLAEFLLEAGPWPSRLKRYISLPNICGLNLLTIIGLYYSAKFVTSLPFPGGNIPQGFSLSFAPDTEAKAIGVILMLVFCLLEFGLYSLFAIGVIQEWDAKAKGVFFTTLACLSLIPLYRFGGSNDFVMRASIPALFVLAVFLGRTLYSPSLDGFKRIAFIALFILGSVTAWVEFRRHVRGIYEAGTLVQTPQISQVMSVDRWRLATEKDANIILQYVGSSQAPFFEFLAKGP